MENNSIFKSQNVQETNIVKLRISKVTWAVFFSKRKKKLLLTLHQLTQA